MMSIQEDIMTHPTPLRASPHHAYKSWTSTWYDEQGKRRTKRFGKVGEVPKSTARVAYDTWKDREWKGKAHVRNPSDPATYTVDALARAYDAYARKTYRKNGKISTHIPEVAAAMNALIDEFGDLAANAVNAPMLTRLRDKMIHSGKRKHRPITLSESTVNGRLRIIKAAYKWARSYGLVGREVAYDVSLVSRLRTGRTEAIAAVPVYPVSQSTLDATLKHCPQTVKDMIAVLLLTGMRSGELCAMRLCDLDTTADVWRYTLSTHKTEHHAGRRSKVVFIGPKVQAIIQPYLDKRKLTDSVFTPMDAHRERLELNGKDKVTAYQTSRSHFKPGRSYTNDTFRNAVQRACDRAFDSDGKRREAHDFAHRWNPHQLRHNAATAFRAEFGLEAAADLLGHADSKTTLIYAERATERAMELARKAG